MYPCWFGEKYATMIIAQKSAIVTDGERGVGASVARRLITAGYGVLLTGSDQSAGSALLRELNAPDQLAFRVTDPGCDEDVAQSVAEAANLFRRLDLLVVNATVGTPVWESPEDLEPERWEAYLRQTVTGSFLFARHTLPYLRRWKGSMVFVAPEKVPKGDAGMELYASSRGGLLAFAETLTGSAAPAVRVNAISPGSVLRDRPGPVFSNHNGQSRADSIAAAVMYFAEAKSVTGQCFDIDDS